VLAASLQVNSRKIHDEPDVLSGLSQQKLFLGILGLEAGLQVRRQRGGQGMVPRLRVMRQCSPAPQGCSLSSWLCSAVLQRKAANTATAVALHHSTPAAVCAPPGRGVVAALCMLFHVP
jgi:hypothetical protein